MKMVDLTTSVEIVLNDASSLEEAVEKEYGYAIDLRCLMWPSDFANDSYKRLYFGTDEISYLREELEEERESENCDPECVLEYEQKIAVCEILQRAFPSRSSILVDVSW
jgi:hypothetical protein